MHIQRGFVSTSGLIAIIFGFAVLVVSPAFAQTDDYGTGATTGTYCPQLFQTVVRGSSGNQVLELQKFLSDYYDISPATIQTGYFGRITQGYVIQFQKEQGLPSYGIAGSMTRAAITKVCGSVASNPVSPTYPTNPTYPVPNSPSNPSASSVTIDSNSALSSNRTISGSISESKQICVSFSRGDVSLPTNLTGPGAIPGYERYECSGLQMSLLTTTAGRWSMSVPCPTVITNGTYTVGVYEQGKFWDGRTNPNSGTLLASKTFVVSGISTAAQCSTNQNQVKVDANTTFSIMSSGAAATPIKIAFYLEKHGTCDQLKADANANSYKVNFGDGSSGVLIARNGGSPGIGIESGVCGLIWDASHAYTTAGSYQSQLVQNGSVIATLQITVVGQ